MNLLFYFLFFLFQNHGKLLLCNSFYCSGKISTRCWNTTVEFCSHSRALVRLGSDVG